MKNQIYGDYLLMTTVIFANVVNTDLEEYILNSSW